MGEKLVQGEVTPDNYIVQIPTYIIYAKDVVVQQILDDQKIIEWVIEKGKIYIVQSRA